MSKVMSLSEAAGLVNDGDVVALQNMATQACPMAMVRELIRQEKKNLGLVCLVGGMAVDMTDHMRAEKVLAESEERFRELAENINEVFWMTDPQTTQLLYISPAYERVWGRSCQSLHENPRSFLDGVHPEDRERVRTAVLENQSRGEQTDKEYRVVRPDG